MIDDVLADLDWLTDCRWFDGEPQGISRAARLVGKWGDDVLWLTIDSTTGAYNVPVVWSDGHAVDATDDPRGQRAILALATACEKCAVVPVEGYSSDTAIVPTVVERLGRMGSARRLTSEQSNTSIIYDLVDGNRTILKVFRVLAFGANPDVELQSVLSDTGTVPRMFAHASLREGGSSADVVVAQEFLEGATDAWQVVTDGLSASDGSLGELEGAIERLGVLTAHFHRSLAERCETAPADDSRRAAMRASWDQRADAACKLLPGLASQRGLIDATYDRAMEETWPLLQRVHGDYHLGQVVDVPGAGWRALDFEGEPLRPLAERNAPDLPERDIAGMLRSFGYAAGAAKLAGGSEEALERWEAAANEAFMRGYGSTEDSVLLRALILDKALYEVAYEASQRPDWLPIPILGVAGILGVSPESL